MRPRWIPRRGRLETVNDWLSKNECGCFYEQYKKHTLIRFKNSIKGSKSAEIGREREDQ
jgi:hypothetical protein